MDRLTVLGMLFCLAIASCRPSAQSQLGLARQGLAPTPARDNTLRETVVPTGDYAFVFREGDPDAVGDAIGARPADGSRLVAQLPNISPRLRRALERQRRLLKRQDASRVYRVGDRELTTKDFTDVIDGLLLHAMTGYQPRAVPVAHDGEVEFTAYFSPDLQAQRRRTPTFSYPLLRAPQDDSLRRLTRAQLAGLPDSTVERHALAWVAHPLDIYLMQLQGSGFVTYPDGTREYLAFDRSNGHPLTPVARALAESEFDVAHRGIKAIRSWMSEALRDRGTVLNACENYVYFRNADTAPTGAGGVPLTSMISVAADPAHYPLGAVLLAEVPNPTKPGIRETRILLVQDVGAAIKGKGRLDLYTGVGSDALELARLTSHVGEVYILTPHGPTAAPEDIAQLL